MTMSPYDNLPTGKNEQNKENVIYEEVSLEPQETSEPLNIPANADSHTEKHNEQQNKAPDQIDTYSQNEMTDETETETLQYIDVPIEELQPEPEPVSTPEPMSESKAEHKNDYKTEHKSQPELKHESILPSTPPVQTHRKASDFAKITPLNSAPEYSKLKLQNMWGTKEYLLPFEETLLVPDTMPDMDTVLLAQGSVTLSQPTKSTYEKTDSVSGEIILYTIYKPATASTAPIDAIKSSVPFKTDKCWLNTEGDFFKVNVSIQNISAEMLNERKFIVKGDICIRFTEIAQKELMIFKGTTDEELVQQESSLKITDLILEASETTEISQEINIHEDQPSPVKILKQSFNIIENHKQITSGKLVINATIISNILYLGQEDDENKLYSLNNKTDFTQFIVVEKDIDPNMIQVSFIGDSLKATIEDQDQFLIEGQIITMVCGYENKEITMVSDAYHKKQDIKFDVSEQIVSCITGTVSGEISSREVVNIDENEKKPETLLCGFGQISDISSKTERGRIVIEGSIDVKILALDEDKNPFIINSTVPLRGSLEMPESKENLNTNVSAAIKEFWFDSINSRQMEINISIALEVWTYSRENYKTIENLCFVEMKVPPKRIPMAIYVVGAEDTLWDIAKRYKSDCNSLAELNQLDTGKPLTVGSKLLIIK